MARRGERLGEFMIMTSVGAPSGEAWNGPDGPGFNQRFIGENSADGKKIAGRWERGIGNAGDRWEIDFPLNYSRK